jgi:hypothetical protein
MEVVWSSARILLQSRVPSDDGARWSAVVVCLLVWLPWIYGFAPSGDPRPDLAWWQIWRRKMLKPVVDVDLVDGGGVAGRRFYGTEERRLPVRAGELPDPRLWGGGAAARRRSVLVFALGIEVQRDQTVFFLCFWTVL